MFTCGLSGEKWEKKAIRPVSSKPSEVQDIVSGVPYCQECLKQPESRLRPDESDAGGGFHEYTIEKWWICLGSSAGRLPSPKKSPEPITVLLRFVRRRAHGAGQPEDLPGSHLSVEGASSVQNLSGLVFPGSQAAFCRATAGRAAEQRGGERNHQTSCNRFVIGLSFSRIVLLIFHYDTLRRHSWAA